MICRFEHGLAINIWDARAIGIYGRGVGQGTPPGRGEQSAAAANFGNFRKMLLTASRAVV